MNNKAKKDKRVLGLIPKLAKKLGEHSVNSACVWWMCQPKVPNIMKKISNQ